MYVIPEKYVHAQCMRKRRYTTSIKIILSYITSVQNKTKNIRASVKMTNDIAYSRAVKGNILQFSIMQCNVTLSCSHISVFGEDNDLKKKTNSGRSAHTLRTPVE